MNTVDLSLDMTVPTETLTLDQRIALLEGFSCSSGQGLRKLYDLAADVLARGIPGDIVECGVFNGGSAAAMAMAVVADSTPEAMIPHTYRRLWLYDSFEGLPAPTAIDGTDAEVFEGHCQAIETRIWGAIDTADFPRSQVVIKKGWFKDTLAPPSPDKPVGCVVHFQDEVPESIAILHLDADWHEPTLLCLHCLYDRVSPGGIIVIDDFGHWEGARHAFYDFIAARGLSPLLERFGHSQAWWVKGRENNREFRGKWELP